jgi:hypothetical protein
MIRQFRHKMITKDEKTTIGTNIALDGGLKSI